MPQVTLNSAVTEISKAVLGAYSKRWVGGIVKISPKLGKEYPYTFFELDTLDPVQHEFVLNHYKKFSLDVIVHRVGKGYHYYGQPVNIFHWRSWYKDLKPLNPDFPTLTLRVTRKSGKEVWEKPQYVQAESPPNDWARALMHFLSKEQNYQNSTDIHSAMRHCGLPKYFKCVVYDVEVVS